MRDAIEVIKWIGIVLAAGFIGYFGRHLAMLIIERIHRGQPQESVATEPPKEATIGQDSRLKLEKKRAKAEAKRAKKAQKK